MCPPGYSPSFDIGSCWTEEEVIMILDKIQHGSPLPGNVLEDVNPFEYRPSNLPNDVWYFVHTENTEGAKLGFWVANGEGCQIYEGQSYDGWRITFEFYDGQSYDGDDMKWMMQKYWITQKGLNNQEASGFLCRVFPCNGGCGKQKRQRCLVSDSVGGQENTLLEAENSCNSQNGPSKKAQVNVRHDETNGENQDNIDYFSRGDYLELFDLVDPRSSSSSSDNSSCVSMASDEVFDYLALLNDLEPENSKEDQSTSTSCNLNVSRSSIPNKVVVSPGSSGRLFMGDGSRSPVETLKVEHALCGSAIEGKLDNKIAKKRDIDGQTHQHHQHQQPGVIPPRGQGPGGQLYAALPLYTERLFP